jgi:hypothetical protein
MKHDFEQRREKRIINAKNRAIKNEQEADQLYNSAKEMASFIPFGQPILVGHHSEKRDRNYREKIHNKFGKSFEMREKAAYYAEKAESIQNNDAIFSDDPQALQKLTEKLKSLQEAQEFMKSANKHIKKNDRESFLKMPHATQKLWEDLITPNLMGHIGFAHYSLGNNGANIRLVQQRIERLKKQSARQPIDKVINGVRIFENREANRLQVIFEGKPEAEVRKQLKSNGFRWSPTENAWQRHISNDAFYGAKEIAESLTN